MNIEAARLFCDLIELQNFTRAAEKHCISQSAVSQQIAQLEATHNCSLIDRTRRPLAPTKAGKLFYEACRDILDRYDRLHNDISALDGAPTRINVAAIFSIGMYTLQPYVKRFMTVYPSVNLSLEYLDANDIHAGVLQDEIDIGLVASAAGNRNINVFPFEQERLLLVCSPRTVWAGQSAIDIRKLQGCNFVAFADGTPSRTLIDGILRRYGVAVKTVLGLDNTETMKRAVEAGTGVSILPEPAIRQEVAGGTLKAISFVNENFHRRTGVIVRKGKTLTQAGRYLMELLGKTGQ